MKTQMLFRGGPLDGMNVSWPHEIPPKKLTGFITFDDSGVEIPPVGSDALLEYHKQSLFVCDMAPEVRAVIYVFQRKS